MQVDGCGVSRSGKKSEGTVGVWAEYEPPTDATPVAHVGREPRFVQTPRASIPFENMNTDPWIFQPGFVWSICRHRPSWQCPPSAACCARGLENRCPQPGDIVLFGSAMAPASNNPEWVLDTVLVVKKKLSGTSDRALEAPYQKLAPTLQGATPYLGAPQPLGRTVLVFALQAGKSTLSEHL